MRAILSAILMSLMMLSPVSAQSPTPSSAQAELGKAVLVVTEYKSGLGAAIEEWRKDHFQKTLIEQVIIEGLTGLEKVVVHDCFAEWYAFQYSSMFTVYMYFASIKTADELDLPPNGFLSPAVMMSQLASQMTPKC